MRVFTNIRNKFRFRKLHASRAFTLSEILITIIVLGIIAALFIGIVSRKKEAELVMKFKTSYAKVDSLLTQTRIASGENLASDKIGYDWSSDKYSLSNLNCTNKTDTQCLQDALLSAMKDSRPGGNDTFSTLNVDTSSVSITMEDSSSHAITAANLKYITLPSGAVVGFEYLDKKCQATLGGQKVCGYMIVDINGKEKIRNNDEAQKIKLYDANEPRERYIVGITEHGLQCGCGLNWTSDDKLKCNNGDIEKTTFHPLGCSTSYSCYRCNSKSIIKIPPTQLPKCANDWSNSSDYKDKDYVISYTADQDNNINCYRCAPPMEWDENKKACVCPTNKDYDMIDMELYSKFTAKPSVYECEQIDKIKNNDVSCEYDKNKKIYTCSITINEESTTLNVNSPPSFFCGKCKYGYNPTATDTNPQDGIYEKYECAYECAEGFTKLQTKYYKSGIHCCQTAGGNNCSSSSSSSGSSSGCSSGSSSGCSSGSSSGCSSGSSYSSSSNGCFLVDNGFYCMKCKNNEDVKTNVSCATSNECGNCDTDNGFHKICLDDNTGDIEFQDPQPNNLCPINCLKKQCDKDKVVCARCKTGDTLYDSFNDETELDECPHTLTCESSSQPPNTNNPPSPPEDCNEETCPSGTCCPTPRGESVCFPGDSCPESICGKPGFGACKAGETCCPVDRTNTSAFMCIAGDTCPVPKCEGSTFGRCEEEGKSCCKKNSEYSCMAETECSTKCKDQNCSNGEKCCLIDGKYGCCPDPNSHVFDNVIAPEGERIYCDYKKNCFRCDSTLDNCWTVIDELGCCPGDPGVTIPLGGGNFDYKDIVIRYKSNSGNWVEAYLCNHTYRRSDCGAYEWYCVMCGNVSADKKVCTSLPNQLACTGTLIPSGKQLYSNDSTISPGLPENANHCFGGAVGGLCAPGKLSAWEFLLSAPDNVLDEPAGLGCNKLTSKIISRTYNVPYTDKQLKSDCACVKYTDDNTWPRNYGVWPMSWECPSE